MTDNDSDFKPILDFNLYGEHMPEERITGSKIYLNLSYTRVHEENAVVAYELLMRRLFMYLVIIGFCMQDVCDTMICFNHIYTEYTQEQYKIN